MLTVGEQMRANLARADLTGVNLTGVNLAGADLYKANLVGANLTGADLAGADLAGANLFVPMACPDAGASIGWKKARDKIVKLEITEDAKQSSATGRKCRCSKARVLEIQNMDGSKAEVCSVSSSRDRNFVYTLERWSRSPTLIKIVGTNALRGYTFLLTVRRQ